MGNPSSEFVPPIYPFDDELETLDFATDANWSAYELSDALRSLDSIYSTLLLTRHLAILQNRRLQASAESQERMWRVLEREGPGLDMFMHEWRRALRRLGPMGASGMIGFPFAPNPQVSDGRASSLELEYCKSNPHEFLNSRNELMIHRIQMASPGGFSLKGLGEPLREIREFIKDIWYRNRQEKERGELDIAKARLDLLAKHNLQPEQIHILAVPLVDAIESLSPRIESKQLRLEDNSTEKLPPPKPRRRRKPKEDT